LNSNFANRCTFDVCLVEKTASRDTLAGVPVVEAVVAFEAPQLENHKPRQVAFELSVIAIGEMAQVLNQAHVGQFYRIQGFLNRKSLKSVKLRLHLTHLSPLSVDDSLN
jgi:primosomal replication protein PriB